jgi:hypothetical protein
LTIKLTLHVVPAHLVVSRAHLFCADKFAFPLVLYLEQNLWIFVATLPPGASRRQTSVACQLIQLSKSFGSRRSVSRLAKRSKHRTEIKNPASSAGPIRLHRRRIRAMLDKILTCIRNRPHFTLATASNLDDGAWLTVANSSEV